MAKSANYNWTTYEDGTTRINFQGDISDFIHDVDTNFRLLMPPVAYKGSGVDRDFNTILDPAFLSSGANCPPRTGFWYCEQLFYASPSLTANRTQRATGYTHNEMWVRHYASDAWSDWEKISNDEGWRDEKGAWTPYFAGENTTDDNSYTLQVGGFQRINNFVLTHFRVAGTKGSNMAGMIAVKGLPYSMKSNGRFGASFSFVSGINYTKQLYGNGYNSTIQFIDGTTIVQSVSVGNNFDIRGNLYYEI